MNEVATIQQFSQEDVQLIKETICKDATDSEFKLFMNQARTTVLNPLARQVFAVKRWDSNANRNVMAIQVSIDGFRLIAERTGKYAGQTPPQWCGTDGVWRDVWLEAIPPAAARVGVLRNDFKEPCYGVARFDSYAQRKKDGELTVMWKKMGDVMIAKCAESLALRKAFPQELSGLYTNDEMEQATPVQDTKPVVKSEITAQFSVVETPANPETGVIGEPHKILVGFLPDGSGSDWVGWSRGFKAAVISSKTPEELEMWVSLNAAAIGNLHDASDKLHGIISSVLTQMRSKLSPNASDDLKIPAFLDRRAEAAE